MSKEALLKKLLERNKKKKITILDRILLTILAVGLILMILFFASLAWFSLSNRSVIHLLPAKETVAYFELEDISLPPSIQHENVFDLMGISALLDKTFNLKIDDLQEHVAPGRLGVSLIKGQGGESQLVLFLRTRNRKKATQYFEGLESQNFVYGFVGPYLLITTEADIIELIRSVDGETVASLNMDPTYQKSLANLPRQSWANGYLNIQGLQFNAETPMKHITSALKPLANHFALTIRKQYNGFHFNTLLSLKPDLLPEGKGHTDSTRFAYNLADYLGSKDLALYVGGMNLSDEWQNTLKTISELNPAYGIILEGIVRAQLSSIFGEDVSLRNDIYPLFEGEYALTLENLENGQMGVRLILKTDDQTFAQAKLDRLSDGFRTLAAQFAPKLKIFELPDGTESRELVADPTRMKEDTEEYKNYQINCLEITDSPYGFCYTVTDELVILSNHPAPIKESIDLSLSPRFNLSSSQSFTQSLSNLSVVSNEISYVDLKNFHELSKDSKLEFISNNLFESFEALTWIKHYFDDGVSTEGFLLLK